MITSTRRSGRPASAPVEVPGQFLAGGAGAKKSVSSWVTRSASSWCTQCEASGRRSNAVQAGDVVVLGLGELGAEVAIAFSPDDQGGRLDRVNLRFGLLGRGPHRGPVVVDHRGGRARLGPGLDVAVGLLRREGRAGVAQEVPEEMPAVGVHDGFGQVGEVEEEEVPGLAELARVVQSLRELPRVGRVEDGQPVHDLGVAHRDGPGDGCRPSRDRPASRSRRRVRGSGPGCRRPAGRCRRRRRRPASMTGCSRACRVPPRGTPPPRAVRSAAARRTRTRGSRAAARPAAPRRPRRNATAGRRSRRSPHEGRRAGPAPARSRYRLVLDSGHCRLPEGWVRDNAKDVC